HQLLRPGQLLVRRRDAAARRCPAGRRAPGPDLAVCQPGGMGNVYTHGHHESVLRSHRWRTADNSAGYLLPRLHPGMRLLDVGCGPGTITTGVAEPLGLPHAVME